MANIIDSISGEATIIQCIIICIDAAVVAVLRPGSQCCHRVTGSQGHEVFEGRFGTQVMFFLGVKTNIHDIEII